MRLLSISVHHLRCSAFTSLWRCSAVYNYTPRTLRSNVPLSRERCKTAGLLEVWLCNIAGSLVLKVNVPLCAFLLCKLIWRHSCDAELYPDHRDGFWALKRGGISPSVSSWRRVKGRRALISVGIMSYPEQLSLVDRGKFTVKETIEETLITQSDPVYRPNHNEGCTALILCFTICGPFSSPGTAEHAVKQDRKSVV